MFKSAWVIREGFIEEVMLAFQLKGECQERAFEAEGTAYKKPQRHERRYNGPFR